MELSVEGKSGRDSVWYEDYWCELEWSGQVEV